MIVNYYDTSRCEGCIKIDTCNLRDIEVDEGGVYVCYRECIEC